MTINTTLINIFTHRKALPLAILLALLIALPALSDGMLMDDYQQRTIMLTATDGNPFDFYRAGTPQTDALVQRGVIHWWLHPASKLVFFRPIAASLMRFDYSLWPNNLILMHLHSVLWYAVLAGVTAFAYRRFMSWSLAAGLAAILFALDFMHSGAVAWLANRNILVAMTGSMLLLLCYGRVQWYWQLLGCLIFTLTLACAEAALAITGYLFAHEVFLSKQSLPKRIFRLLPYALITLAYLAFWRYRGYGSGGPGPYTDPLVDPVGYLQSFAYRAPSIFFGQFAAIPLEILELIKISPAKPYTLIALLIGSAIVVKMFWPLLCDSALARFYGLGMCIAIIPIGGVQLSSRVLFYVGFGAIGLMALLCSRVFFDMELNKSRRRFAAVMLFLHLVISPILFVITIKGNDILDHQLDTRTLHLPDETGSEKNVLLLSVHSYALGVLFPLFKDEGLSVGSAAVRPPPSILRLRALTSGKDEFELLRADEDTVIVYSESGFGGMRQGKYGFAENETVKLDDVTIIVRAINADRAATKIEYRFSPGALRTYEVLKWGGKYFVPAELPSIGGKTKVKTPMTF